VTDWGFKGIGRAIVERVIELFIDSCNRKFCVYIYTEKKNDGWEKKIKDRQREPNIYIYIYVYQLIQLESQKHVCMFLSRLIIRCRRSLLW
jgi:hypothetical protein